MIPDQHHPFSAMEATMYLIHDVPERTFDERLCTSEDDVRTTIEHMDLQPGKFHVWQITLGERAYDVTADFVPDEDDEPSAIDIPSPDELYRQHMARVL